MGAVAAVIIRREKDLVAHFQQAGATSLPTARSLPALQVDGDMIFRRLRDSAVLREGATGTWYLDEPSWIALRRTRQRVVLILLTIVLALGVTAFLASRG